MITYDELFSKQRFDPVNSLFAILRSERINKKDIKLNDILNNYAKQNVSNCIEHSNQDINEEVDEFKPGTYKEFYCFFKLKEDQIHNQLSIAKAVFDEIKENNDEFLNTLSNVDNDLAGVYTFISHEGLVICSVCFAQSSPNSK